MKKSSDKFNEEINKIFKKIDLNDQIKSDCVFLNDFGGFTEADPNIKQKFYGREWQLLCLLNQTINVFYKFQFPPYVYDDNLERTINDMKLRQLLEYFKIYELRPDNISSILFYKENKLDGLILDYVIYLRYSLGIIYPSRYPVPKKVLLKNQLYNGMIELSEFWFLSLYIQYKNEENIIENLKKKMFQLYFLNKQDSPTVVKYYKQFGMSKEKIFSSRDNMIKFLYFLFKTPFYTKEFSLFIDPIIINSIQWLNNLPNNSYFQKYADKREKDIKRYKFNFKETFGKTRLIDKDKIIDEIKKTRKILKLPTGGQCLRFGMPL